jgi:PIN domain nuclease of toxin-antitoxin system
VNGLLLDTHVWIWYAEGIASRLPVESVARIEEMRKQSRLFVSAISVWEVGMLHGKQKLALSAPLDAWVARAADLPGLGLLPLDTESALESTWLPGTIHGDPADRFLVAIARMTGAHLMTADRKIIEYAGTGYVNVVPIGGFE